MPRLLRGCRVQRAVLALLVQAAAAAAFANSPRVGLRAGMSSDNPFEAFRYGGSTANAHGSLHSERKRPASPARGGSAAADDASSPANRTKDAAGESAQGSPAKAARKNKGKPAPKARLCEPPAVKNFDGWLPVYERGPAGAGDAEILPFVSGVPGGWRERWCGVCDDCFEKGRQCFEYPEVSLSLRACAGAGAGAGACACMHACVRACVRVYLTCMDAAPAPHAHRWTQPQRQNLGGGRGLWQSEQPLLGPAAF